LHINISLQVLVNFNCYKVLIYYPLGK